MDGFDRKTREVADATHVRSEKIVEEVTEQLAKSGNAFGMGLEEMRKKVSAVTKRVSDDLEDLPRIAEAIEAAAAGAESAAKAAENANLTAAKTITLTRSEMEKAHKNLQDALVALTNGFASAYRDYLDGLRKLADQ